MELIITGNKSYRVRGKVFHGNAMTLNKIYAIEEELFVGSDRERDRSVHPADGLFIVER